ncbi:MAG: nucleotidyltransferase domain-containing protein [Candidatus Pacebacteria bacterium]|nr:nucleotidyltransferase domain-containing protein [Candidatus Paceibacterota bacterium]
MAEKLDKNQLLQKIAQKYSLRLILLFGSQVDAKQLHKESDFDVAYLSKRKLDLMEEAQMMTEMAPYFHSDNIDLVNLKNASPLLYYAVFDNCKILFQEDELLFPTLRIYAFRKFVEMQPIYELQRQRLREYAKQISEKYGI